MPIPQRLNFVTLGARSVGLLRDFYGRWGWTENEGASDDYASFTLGTVRLGLYTLHRLGDEAAPGERLPEARDWNGLTLAINFHSSEEVDVAVRDAMSAGATLVESGTARDWGGYSAYIADPEGVRWELAWAPDFDPEPSPDERA